MTRSIRTVAVVLGVVTCLAAVSAATAAPPAHAASAGRAAADAVTGQPDVDARGQSVAPDVVAEVEELLSRRDAARAAGDVDAVLATLAPDAPTSLIDDERRSVEQGAEIGVAGWTESLSAPVVDLTPPSALDGHLVLAVDRRWRVSGIDTWDRASTVVYTFAQGDGGWSIAADDALAHLGWGSDRQLWEIADVDVVRSDRVLVVGDAGRGRLEGVADVTAEALVRFDERWDPAWQRSWSGSVMVIVPDGIRRLEELLRPTGDASRFVAFTTLDIDRRDGWTVVSPRIVTQESNLSRRAVERQIEVMVHELAHVASVGESGPSTPLWMHEGFAEWVTAGRPVGDGDLVFPDLDVFRTGDVAAISAAYAQAESTMAVLAGELGSGAVWDLFERTGARRSDAGSADHVVGTLIDELIAAVR